MTVTTAMIDDLMLRSQEIVRRLANDLALNSYVDAELPLPRPFIGRGEIQLVIIGQDPTVENEASRKKIATALMLDGNGPLPRFLSSVCAKLGFSLENVYATNVCKNFFKQTPTQIKEARRIDVIGLSHRQWMPLLQEELAWFPNAAIISLGQPSLRCLVRPGFSHDVKSYWGYRQGWSKQGFDPFRPVIAEQSVIDRTFFPFVHLNTNRKSRSGAFYKIRLNDYFDFIRDQIRKEANACQS